MIKKHKNKNDYFLSKSGHWVRDFTKPLTKGIDINNLIPFEDMNLMLANEIKNQEKMHRRIDVEEISHDKIIIIGDGYQSKWAQELIQDLTNDVIVIGVNGAFAEWTSNKRMNYYVVNNPYDECLSYFPRMLKAWPKCVASTRTCPKFLEHYQGLTYVYAPIYDTVYSGVKTEMESFIDDYRNPVCAAIALAYKFKVKKLLLLSLVDMYEESRPATEKIKDMWIYPQQKMSHSLIDANLHWLQKAKIHIAYSGKTIDYEFATYISPDKVKGFFNERT